MISYVVRRIPTRKPHDYPASHCVSPSALDAGRWSMVNTPTCSATVSMQLAASKYLLGHCGRACQARRPESLRLVRAGASACAASRAALPSYSSRWLRKSVPEILVRTRYGVPVICQMVFSRCDPDMELGFLRSPWRYSGCRRRRQH